MTSIAIDFNGITTTYVVRSLYIPRVFLNISEEDIISVFKTLCLGEVERVDLAPRITPRGRINSNMAFVYFKTWSMSVAAQHLAERIVDTKRDAKIVYDDPWFWILLPNSNPLPSKPTNIRACELVTMVEGLEERLRVLEHHYKKQTTLSHMKQSISYILNTDDVGAVSQSELSQRWAESKHATLPEYVFEYVARS